MARVPLGFEYQLATYTSRYAQFFVYLDTYTQLLAGMAGRLLY